MSICSLCPRGCGIDRSQSVGACSVGDELVVGSVVIHRGEEPPLVHGAGSGAIFFSGCALKCSYCQNAEISHRGRGQKVSAGDLALYMVKLQEKGCSNINLVTPTHFTPQILRALEAARSQGLKVPIVINSGGYETPSTLQMWREYADIYLMDLKYGDNAIGERLSNVADYWDIARVALARLVEEVGPLRTDRQGMGTRGLIVRHLVLPGMLSNPFAVLEFLSELSPDIPISIMSQYNPLFYQGDIPEMKRRIDRNEYSVVLERAIDLGFSTIYSQDLDAPHTYVPDFQAQNPFGDCRKLL